MDHFTWFERNKNNIFELSKTIESSNVWLEAHKNATGLFGLNDLGFNIKNSLITDTIRKQQNIINTIHKINPPIAKVIQTIRSQQTNYISDIANTFLSVHKLNLGWQKSLGFEVESSFNNIAKLSNMTAKALSIPSLKTDINTISTIANQTINNLSIFNNINDFSDITDIFDDNFLDKLDDIIDELYKENQDNNSDNYKTDHFDKSGTVTIVRPEEEIREVIKYALKESGIKDSIDEGFNELISIAKASQNNFKTIILGLLINILTIFATPYIENYRDNIFSMVNQRQAIRTIKQEVSNSSLDKSTLKDYRYTTAKPYLNVRSSSTINSQKKGKLYLGTIIKVIYKKKNWIKVEWEDEETGEYKQGWVFTRYTKKF
jgi:hypothetical protein